MELVGLVLILAFVFLLFNVGTENKERNHKERNHKAKLQVRVGNNLKYGHYYVKYKNEEHCLALYQNFFGESKWLLQGIGFVNETEIQHIGRKVEYEKVPF